jgi:hypothetical protein
MDAEDQARLLVDLDPLTWRHIGHFFDPGQYIRMARPGEHGLFILHDQGTVLILHAAHRRSQAYWCWLG